MNTRELKKIRVTFRSNGAVIHEVTDVPLLVTSDGDYYVQLLKTFRGRKTYRVRGAQTQQAVCAGFVTYNW